MAKAAMWRLKHPVLTSEHLLYACLRLHDQRHWELCRDLPVTFQFVWAHLREGPPFLEASEEFYSVRLGASAKAAFERAESETSRSGIIGTGALMRALVAESEGPVRSLLDVARSSAFATKQ
jgi:Clp amino terminal domain, pathogenicity island component